MTAAELFAMTMDDRIDYRLIRGRLIERAYPFRCPAHAALLPNLYSRLWSWLKSPAGVGWQVYGYGCPYRIRRDPDTVLAYDASVIAAELDSDTTIDTQFIDGRPTLAVEVLDLSDPQDAVGELIDVTVTSGVPMMWFIDPFEETVAVYRPGQSRVVLGRHDVLDAVEVIPGLRCRVDALFE
jgi:Uma2 family endonuclease